MAEIILNFILQYLPSLLLAFFYVSSWKKLINDKIDKNKFLISILIISFIIPLIDDVFSKNVKMILSVIFLLVINYYAFTRSIKKTIISVFTSQFIVIIAEAIISVALNTVLKIDVIELSYAIYGKMIINTSVALLSFIL